MVDEILDSVEDLSSVFITAFAGKEKEEEKKEAAVELCKEGGPFRYWAEKFLNRQQEAEKRGVKSGFFIGEELTIAELKFNAGFGFMLERLPPVKSIMESDKFKSLLKIIEAVNGNDKVKAFEEQFKKNQAAFKEKPEENVFKYAGKSVSGAF